MKTFGKQWKDRIRNGETVIGGHIFLPNPSMAEAMVSFGFEYLWIDGEHGHFDKDAFYNHIVAVNGAGGGVFVRVTTGEPFLIKPVLEMGPDGIVFPMICTALEAKTAMDACIYPPGGSRGFGPRRASRYGTISDAEYLESINECLVKIIQIEHIDGVNNLNAILDIKGIDGIVIGPYDLSYSLGLPGRLKHPDFFACCKKIFDICKSRGVPCGVSTGYVDDEYMQFMIDQKINFIFCGDDLAFIKAGVTQTIKNVKNGIARRK